jgi:heme-degrading monooxygenase HmoA
MGTNEIDDEAITLINVFEIDPAKLESFLGEWRKRAEFMSKQPGFRSFRLQRALSPDTAFQLVNVAEWDNADTLRAATAQPEFQASARRSLDEHDVTAHPGVYRVAVELIARQSR